MKKLNQMMIIASITIICSVVCNIAMLLHMKWLMETGNDAVQWMGAAVAAGIIIVGILHALGLIGVFAQFKGVKRESIARAGAFVIGLVSLFLLAVDAVMLQDIGNEHTAGLDISGEWGIVLIGHGFHALFGAVLLLQCLIAGKAMINGAPEDAVKDEVLFLTVHQTGIVAAAIGLVFIALLYGCGLPAAYMSRLLLTVCIVMLLPYAAVALYWLYTKRRAKMKEWYDEKQLIDISRGALAALVSSVFVMAMIFLLSVLGCVNMESVIWFPVYFFLTLLIFSGSALYLSKRG